MKVFILQEENREQNRINYPDFENVSRIVESPLFTHNEKEIKEIICHKMAHYFIDTFIKEKGIEYPYECGKVWKRLANSYRYRQDDDTDTWYHYASCSSSTEIQVGEMYFVLRFCHYFHTNRKKGYQFALIVE